MSKSRVREWFVCHFHSLPEWLQDNEFLHFGHRPPLPSYKDCLKSVFRLHTETGNIWTHLIGFAIFMLMAFEFLLFAELPISSTHDYFVIGSFLFCAVICFGFSVAYHTFSCHSREVGTLFCKLDYCGIAFLIAGSLVPFLYYGFWCNTHLKIFYLSLIVVLGIITISLSLWDRFNHIDYRPFRATVFSSFGLSAIFPSVHRIVTYDMHEVFLWDTFINSIQVGALYLAGVLVYALRIPERFFPGKCDYWFHSHQVFHVLVMIAAFVHYQGINDLALNRLSSAQIALCASQDVNNS